MIALQANLWPARCRFKNKEDRCQILFDSDAIFLIDIFLYVEFLYITPPNTEKRKALSKILKRVSYHQSQLYARPTHIQGLM